MSVVGVQTVEANSGDLEKSPHKLQGRCPGGNTTALITGLDLDQYADIVAARGRRRANGSGVFEVIDKAAQGPARRQAGEPPNRRIADELIRQQYVHAGLQQHVRLMQRGGGETDAAARRHLLFGQRYALVILEMRPQFRRRLRNQCGGTVDIAFRNGPVEQQYRRWQFADGFGAHPCDLSARSRAVVSSSTSKDPSFNMTP